MKLRSIIDRLNLVTFGDTDCEVTGIAAAERATEAEIAIVEKENQVFKTKAKVMLTTSIFARFPVKIKKPMKVRSKM